MNLIVNRLAVISLIIGALFAEKLYIHPKFNIRGNHSI